MKCLFSLILLLIGPLCFAQERKLALEVEPIDTGMIMNAVVWDFSTSSVIATRPGLTTTMYGDSLLGEYAGGHREWFAIRGGSLSYAGEEEKDYLVSSDTLLTSFDFPLISGERHRSAFQNRGRIYSRYAYAEEGTASTETGATGRLIIAAGDTLSRVTVTREERMTRAAVNTFAETFPLAPSDSLRLFQRCVYRWYDGNGFFPVAVQTLIRTFDSLGQETGTKAQAFIIDPADLALSERVPENLPGIDPAGLRQALAEARAVYSNGTVTVNLSLGGDALVGLMIDIVDLPGNLYRHVEETASGEVSIAIPVSDLSPREYVVVISSPLLPNTLEKRYIKIY